MEIKDNVFVVTGGGSGLGAATAKMIVAAGGKVVLADVNKEAGDALATELGANARFVATDVTDEASAKACFAAAVEMGTLRGLVNCAGVAPADLFPYDLDRAFKSLDRIKKDVRVWWSQSPQSQQLLRDGGARALQAHGVSPVHRRSYAPVARLLAG